MTRTYAIPPTQNGVPLAGATAHRPANQPHGQTWFNETTKQIEARDDLTEANYAAQTAATSFDLVDQVTEGAPTDGTSGTGAAVAGKGSLCRDVTNGVLYINTGTKASPTWTKVGTQS